MTPLGKERRKRRKAIGTKQQPCVTRKLAAMER